MKKNTDIIKNNECEVCKSKNIKNVINFKPSPLGDIYLPFKKRKLSRKLYPLDLYLCKKCGYLFLIYKINPKLSYSNYVYESNKTVGLVNHYDSYAKEISKKLKLSNSSKILDIGSNDGSMLNSFKKIGLMAVGIEPAPEIAKNANKRGLKTLNGYLENKTTQILKKEFESFDVITANYVFANILDINSFIANVYKLLSANGSFIIQTGYHPNQFKKNMFDYVYHEHFSYFSIHTIESLVRKHKLKLIDVDINNKKGGSVRVIITKNLKTRQKKLKISRLKRFEKNLNIKSTKYFNNFEKRIEKLKKKSIDFLEIIQAQNKKVVGFGASHSVTTLMFHFELNKYFDYLIDDNTKKHNLYSPGSELLVRKVSFNKSKPDYIFILAWQHQKTILKKYSYLKKQGVKFIIPLPSFRVI